MKFSLLSGAALLVLASPSFVAPAAAQGAAGFELRTNPALLMNPKVQADMKVTSAQSGAVMQALQASAPRIMPLMQKMGKDPSAMKQMMVEYRKMEADALKPLNPAQRKRLREITLQTIGPAAVVSPSVSQQLGLTTPQKSKISGAISAASKSAYASMQGGKPDMRSMMAMQDKIKTKVAGVVAATLTAPQRAKWAAMQGRKLDLGPMMGMGGMIPGGR